MEQGIILKGIGGFYYVQLMDGSVLECKARGRFRRDRIKPMVGDRVEVERTVPGEGFLLSIQPRRNSLIRPAIANVDQAFVVVTPRDPEPNLLLIDKILAICALRDIQAVVVVNKTDLDSGDELVSIYEGAGYPCIRACATQGVGIDEIRSRLAGKISFFSGSSGIGKSSIINQLEESIHMEVGAISDKIARGRHTTRHVELFPLTGGGYIADTPGFSSFDLEKLDVLRKEELVEGFPDIARYSNGCRFTGCSHTCEKGCAVLEAAQKGLIAPSRLESYKMLYEQLKQIKEWER
ncbi:MAG: ribosome small subunit-dependent GTPase A [Eubacteriales bacterium]|jgi:ribosome biogenesis GTPase